MPKNKPTVIATLEWSDDVYENAESRRACGENIDVDHINGYIVIKYYDKNPMVVERQSDCVEFEDFR